MNVPKSLGRWLLYSLCLAPAVVMLGYYALEYIPQQREYFMNLRFRSLANIGGQVRMKIERLLTALDYATKSDGQSAEYIRALVPELAYRTGECGNSAKSFQFGVAEDTIRFKATYGCAADASLSKIFCQFTADDLFDDVIVAERNGRVVYQRSKTSPRIVNLDDLRKAPSGLKSASASGTGSDADAVRYLRLDNSDFALLLQPVSISIVGVPEQTLIAGGLVRSARLAEEARHVPPLYLLVIFVPLLIVLLSGPFLKILLLTRTGRLSFHDLALLGGCAVITAGLLTLLLTSWRQYWSGDTHAEADLKKFAVSVDKQLAEDIRHMRSTIEQLDSKLPADIESQTEKDRKNLFGSGMLDGLDLKSIPPFDFVFWTNRQGQQVAKWTTKRFNTQRVDQTQNEHFENLLAKKFWSIDEKKFTLQTLISPTTSQLIVVLGIPSRHAPKETDDCPYTKTSGEIRKDSGIEEAAIVGLLPSVTSPVVPPGAGFAIFDPHGNVIFHSSPARNLRENLFDEFDSPAPWEAAAAMHVAMDGSVYYRGLKYKFHAQPVNEIQDSDWNIATFRELEPRQAMIGVVWSETLALFLGPLFLGTAALLLLSTVLRGLLRQTWREQVEVLLISLWPDPSRAPVFQRLAKELGVLTAVSLAAVVFGSVHAYQFTAWLLPFCYLAPLAAVVLSVMRFRKGERASRNRLPAGRGTPPSYAISVSLLLIMLAVVPVIGLFSVCHAFESRLHVMYWQRELVNSWDARRSRIEAAINSSPAFDDASRKWVLHLFHRRDELTECDGNDYINSFWHTFLDRRGITEEHAGAAKAAWWQNLLASIRPGEQAGAVDTGVLAGGLAESSACQWETPEKPGFPTLSCQTRSGGVQLRSELPKVDACLDPLWWLAMVAMLGVGYAWNCRAISRLFLQDFDYSPLPVLTDLRAPDMVLSDLLVIGLPLARKDEAVRQWLGYAPPRVNLYAAQFSEGWLEQTIAHLRQELTAAPVFAAEVAASGTTAQTVHTVSRKQSWVHISNLETKLGTPEDRKMVADLVQAIVTMDLDGARPRLIVTSTIDPVFHFESVLSDERQKVYEHPLNQPELQRISRLLHNFRPVQVPDPAADPPEWANSAAGAIVYDECRHNQALLAVGEEVTAAAPPARREALLARVAERSAALYKLFWASCTRSEKLLLVQLAQTGLVNPLCEDTLQTLIRKGLVLPGSRPRIMNETFLRFLAKVKSRTDVRRWEIEAGENSWVVIRNVVLVLIVAGLAVVFMTQREAMQTVTAVLTGVATVMAGVFRLAGYFGGHREVPAEPMTHGATEAP